MASVNRDLMVKSVFELDQTIDTLFKGLESDEAERALRIYNNSRAEDFKKYPALKEAWDQYQMVEQLYTGKE